ncbi:MAG: crotonyl-CoA carboxylase/reductase [Acidimicrobiia bacterium]|nr:crotonyl-CoA carboxylase/reductase [Acidimicrobiia bacterium]
MKEILEAILTETSGAELADLPLPDSMRGAIVRRDEVGMFDGMASADKDPRKSVHVEEVPIPPLGPNEVRVAVMASSINYNTVWTSMFEPLPTFGFLDRRAKGNPLAARHNLDWQVIGSDASGVVLDVGPGVTKWKTGDRVVVHPIAVDMEDHFGHDDGIMDPSQAAWGFETNFGGLGEIALVKATQLMPKPEHLTWEEAATVSLVSTTAYRMLVSPNGAQMKQGDVVLVWGATGGIGGMAVQYVLNGGGIPVGVVSSPKRVELAKALGCERVIDRSAEGLDFWTEDGTQDQKVWRKLGQLIRELTGGEDPDIVYEHPGRSTFGASVFVAKRGGTVVTCASTTGFAHEFDNRYLWMNLKRIIGSHCANYKEAWEALRLTKLGAIHPIMSKSYPLEEAPDAINAVHHNEHEGKLGVRVLAPVDGLGVMDQALRAQHEDAIDVYRRFA